MIALCAQRLFVLLLAITAFSNPCLVAGPVDGPCTYYASPVGDGNGKSPQTPFQVSNFWRLAKPDDTLCLEEGGYRGTNSMISPPRNLHGGPENPITVRALHEGKVLIDGEGKHAPVLLLRKTGFL